MNKLLKNKRTMDEEDLLIFLLLLFILLVCVIDAFSRDRKICCYKQKNNDYVEV